MEDSVQIAIYAEKQTSELLQFSSTVRGYHCTCSCYYSVHFYLP